MQAVRAEGLTKRFGNLTAVDGVSFSVREGEIFGFLGPNGAGKTTTINMLITLLRPTAGEAWVAGHSVLREPREVRRRIGVVFQDPSLDRDLTGRENLVLHGLAYGMGREEIQGRISELLEFVELTPFADRQVKTYSGGMVRRLEIARALVHDPDILFLDEPTLGLDPQTRARIWDYISRLRREEGTTIFMTTHYMDEAEALCDRVAIIDHGRIVALGPPEKLKASLGSDVVYVEGEGDLEALGRSVVDAGLAADFSLSGGELRLRVRSASAAVPRILEVASTLGIRVDEVTYRRPSLGDVFLHLTGRRLRDEEASPPKLLHGVRRRFS
ncbi:MAG: ATP-binding cassette domain-containing protein [Thermoplasmata archaeon]|nr:ATP-binding cassette domain-containing protein [Thermoplasmata archaeon]